MELEHDRAGSTFSWRPKVRHESVADALAWAWIAKLVLWGRAEFVAWILGPLVLALAAWHPHSPSFNTGGRLPVADALGLALVLDAQRQER